MRRQNRSCDQCRKAKRACNAPSLWDVHGKMKKRPRPGTEDAATLITLTEQDLDEYETCASPCSHCLRTGKQCTLHWVRNQLRSSLTSKSTGTSDRRSPGKPPSIPWQPSPSSESAFEADTTPAAEPATAPGPTSSSASSPPEQLLPEEGSPKSNSTGVLELSWASISTPSLTPPDLADSSYGAVPINTFDEPVVVGAVFNTEPTTYPIHPAEAALTSDFESPTLPAQHGFATTAANDVNELPLYEAQQTQYAQAESSPLLSGSYQTNMGSAFNASQYSSSVTSSTPSISPFSTASLMASNTNKKLISDNLMRIYHDAFEFALTCCLSPEACPYQLSEQSPQSVSWLACRYDTISLMNQYDPDQKETIIYHRVTKLDRAAQKSGLIRLTKVQDRAISKALYLSILAYATQWAQGSQREREQYPPNLNDPHLDYAADDVSSEFDRVLQKSLWTQAKRALDDCSDIECFRIVCADWIMGLTQRPMEKDDLDFDVPQTVFGSKTHIVGGRGSVASRTSDILATAGPPIFTERAARKVHALKYRYETRRAGICEVEDNFSELEPSPPEAFAPDDISTFGLMYWMTIMIDTIASAMHNRPIVISDEECQHNATYIGHLPSIGFDIDCSPHDMSWWAGLFDNDLEESCVLLWPCSTDTAVKAIIASTPVKVVLFRHVVSLQSTVRNNYCGEIVENIISNAMAVYKHWRMTYGALFRGFVDNYDTVPLHMRVWFIHVIVYFHYAALLLADIIEVVDMKGLGVEFASQVRMNVGIVGLLRSGSTKAVSDLARVATSPNPQSTEFHFAVVLQPILPEPWTMMLIKCFTKTAILYLAEVAKVAQREPLSLQTPPVMMLVNRCEYCVKAVYCLGKKSDMAQAISVVLYSALKPYLAVC